MNNRPTKENRPGCESRRQSGADVVSISDYRAARQQAEDQDSATLFEAYKTIAALAQQTRRLDLALIAGRLWGAFVWSFCDQ